MLFGFQLDPETGELVPEEKEQAVIALAQLYHARGTSLQAIAARLLNDGQMRQFLPLGIMSGIVHQTLLAHEWASEFRRL